MSRLFDPRGRSTFGIGICDRCQKRFSLEDLHSDPNTPGLRVCIDDLDDFDPYRLPAREPEDITLRFTRPDVPLTGRHAQLNLSYALRGDDGEFVLTEDGKFIYTEDVPQPGDPPPWFEE